jgi:apolipoprotein N-acyltransferase
LFLRQRQEIQEVPRKIAPVLTGLLFGLSFPPFNFAVFAWFALVPVLWSIRKYPQAILRQGFIAGLVANLIIYLWIWPTFNAAKIGLVVTLACWVALASIFALYFMAFFGGTRLFKKRVSRIVGLAALWVMLDFIRSIALTG